MLESSGPPELPELLGLFSICRSVGQFELPNDQPTGADSKMLKGLEIFIEKMLSIRLI